MSSTPLDNIILQIIELYTSLKFNPPANQYTILASFFLTARTASKTKIISLGTGTKCLPLSRLPIQGEALHDSHAEIIAKRGAIRWFLEEIHRYRDVHFSDWITVSKDESGSYELKEDIEYLISVSGGDASTRYLATFQESEMAALKDSSYFPTSDPTATFRGRDNYALLGVLRTKPGRSDSPSTTSMTCSDKIASWNFLGIQSAIGSHFLEPIYISSIVIGEVASEMRESVKNDCERAFWKRIDGLLECTRYSLRHPIIKFTEITFPHSRTILLASGFDNGSCKECLSWIADSQQHTEVLINGIKRGVPSKHRYQAKNRASILHLYGTLELNGSSDTNTYRSAKNRAIQYQNAKTTLMGHGGPFMGWIRNDSAVLDFNIY